MFWFWLIFPNQICYSSSSLSNEIKAPSLPKISDHIEQSEPKPEIFDDDTSKLTFKEKMILFNKKKNNGLNTSSSSSSSSLKTSRNRLTQVFYPHIHAFSLVNIWLIHRAMCVGDGDDSKREEKKDENVYLQLIRMLFSFYSSSQSLRKKFKQLKISQLNHRHRPVQNN